MNVEEVLRKNKVKLQEKTTQINQAKKLSPTPLNLIVTCALYITEKRQWGSKPNGTERKGTKRATEQWHNEC